MSLLRVGRNDVLLPFRTTVLKQDCLRTQVLASWRWRSQAASVIVPREDVQGADDTTTSSAGLGKVDFMDTKTAYRAKTTPELLRAYIVFGMCSIDALVKNQMKLLGWSRRLLGQSLFTRLMRSTVYGQFMGGDTDPQVLQRANRNRKYGVHSMFAYTAAEDHGFAKGSSAMPRDEEAFHEENYLAFMNSVDMAAQAAAENQETVKISGKFTFLTTYDVLRTITDLISANTTLVDRVLTSRLDNDVTALTNLVINLEPKMKETAAKYGLPAPKLNPSSIHWPSLTTSLSFHLTMAESSEAAKLCQKAGITTVTLTDDQKIKLLSLMKRLTDISQKAAGKDVSVLLDAEQTYLQLAMDVITLDLMRMLNTTRAVVHNTYQCYLKRAYDIVTRDLELAERENFCLGLKVVRGGYMDEERSLAASLGDEDPVNPTYDATTDMYHKVANELLHRIRKSPPGRIHLTVATHNENTVQFVMDRMQEIGMTPSPLVSFGQLLGMRDHIAFMLGANGVHGSKLVHYGPVEGGVAYLSRRIAENKSGLPTADLERHLVRKELGRRLRQGELRQRKEAAV